MPPKVVVPEGNFQQTFDQVLEQIRELKSALRRQWRALAVALEAPFEEWKRDVIPDEDIQRAVNTVIDLIPNDQSIQTACAKGLGMYLCSMTLQCYVELNGSRRGKPTHPSLRYVGHVLAHIYLTPAGRQTCRENQVLDHLTGSLILTGDPRAVESGVYACRVACSLGDHSITTKFTGNRFDALFKLLGTHIASRSCIMELCRHIALAASQREGRSIFQPGLFVQALERYGDDRAFAIQIMNAWDGLIRGSRPINARREGNSAADAEGNLQLFRTTDPAQSGDAMSTQVLTWLAQSPLKNDAGVVAASTQLLGSCALWCTEKRLKVLISEFLSRLAAYPMDKDIVVNSIYGLQNAWVELVRIVPGKAMSVVTADLDAVIYAAFRHLTSLDVQRAALCCVSEVVAQNAQRFSAVKGKLGLLELAAAAFLRPSSDPEDMIYRYAGILMSSFTEHTTEAEKGADFFPLVMNLTLESYSSEQLVYILQALCHMLKEDQKLTKLQRTILMERVPEKAFQLCRERFDKVQYPEVAMILMHYLLKTAHNGKQWPISQDDMNLLKRLVSRYPSSGMISNFGTKVLARCVLAGAPEQPTAAAAPAKAKGKKGKGKSNNGQWIEPKDAPASSSPLPSLGMAMIQTAAGDAEKLGSGFEILIQCRDDGIPVDIARVGRIILSVINHYPNVPDRPTACNIVMMVQNALQYDRTIGLDARKAPALDGICRLVSNRIEDHDILDTFCFIMEACFTKMPNIYGQQPLEAPTKAELNHALSLNVPTLLLTAARTCNTRNAMYYAFYGLMGFDIDKVHSRHAALRSLNPEALLVRAMRAHMDDDMFVMSAFNFWSKLYCMEAKRSECPVDAAWAEPDMLTTIAEAMRRYEDNVVIQLCGVVVLKNVFNRAPLELSLYHLATTSGVFAACQRISVKHQKTKDLVTMSGYAIVAMCVRDGINPPGVVMQASDGRTFNVSDLAPDQASDGPSGSGGVMRPKTGGKGKRR